MNELKNVFNYEGSEIRTIIRDGNPWFVAKDVCVVLEINNNRMALQRLDEDEKADVSLTDGSQNRNYAIVNEAGLYTLILGSRKPEARAFKRWITHEILPSIRKTGGYVSNDDLFIQTYLPFADEHTKQLFGATLETVRKQNELITVMKPKVEQHDRFISADNLQSIDDVAKSLGIGSRKLIAFLKVIKVFKKNGRPRPVQKYINEGCFEVKQIPSPQGDYNYAQTFVTPKGISRIDRALTQFGGSSTLNAMKVSEIEKMNKKD